MTTMKVKLSSARVGHNFDTKGRFTGQFSQASGDIVDMPTEEAQRYLERGLASKVHDDNQKKG